MGTGAGMPQVQKQLPTIATRTRIMGTGFHGYGYGYGQKYPQVTHAEHYLLYVANLKKIA